MVPSTVLGTIRGKKRVQPVSPIHKLKSINFNLQQEISSALVSCWDCSENNNRLCRVRAIRNKQKHPENHNMVVNCSIPYCKSNSKNTWLFPIPPPSENYDMGIKWIHSIIHSYPNFSLDNINHIYVCSKHFKDKHFIPPDMQLLKSFAIPTEFRINNYICINVYSKPTNNTETDRNTKRGISANVNNNFHPPGEDSVKVITVPNQSYNTIETRPTPQNVFNHKPPTENAQIQEPSEQTATTSSRSSRPKKRKLDCDYCNSKDSEGN
ncbi:hypothetical protein ACI65C_011417 [Semiaphis heraclei]